MNAWKSRLALVCTLMLVGGAALASKEYNAPRAQPAKTYPAHDGHPTENVTVAADPYDVPEKTSPVFILPYRDKGYLPIHLVITNDGDQPISLSDIEIRLVTGNRSKLQPASPDDLYRRFTRVARRGDEPSRNPLPIPLPRRPDTGLPKGAADEIVNAQFGAKAVEPHGTQSGFLFFDVEGIREPLAGAHLYITGVRDGRGAELMFFDIALEKYLSAGSQK